MSQDQQGGQRGWSGGRKGRAQKLGAGRVGGVQAGSAAVWARAVGMRLPLEITPGGPELRLIATGAA